MAVHITPAMRVEQFPDEFMVKKNQLWCMWCDKVINHKRKDNMNEHMWSKAHQDSRVAHGAKMSYDVASTEAVERRKRRCQKAAKSKAKKDAGRKHSLQMRAPSISGESTSDEDESGNLRQLFQDSDSDSSTSFEGFNTTPQKNLSETTEDDDSRRSARSRKRPAKLDDSLDNDEIAKIGKIADQAAFVSSMARRKKYVEEYSASSSPDHSPPPRIRSMPIKKQISYSARQPNPTASPPRLPLKMKFSRKPDSKRSSREYGIDRDEKIKVVPGSGAGEELKLKFVWKKKQRTSSTEDFKGIDEDSISSSGAPAGYEEMLKGITEGTGLDTEVASETEEVIEEEIVEMDGDVVIEDNWVSGNAFAMGGKTDNELLDNKITESSVNKHHQVSKMASSATKEKLGSKRWKKEYPSDEKKRKMTGYMLWAKQMREKVSKQYPGLEFGDVSKKLGDLWKKIPDKEKQMWKFRNMKIEKQSHMKTFRKSGSKMIETGPKKKPLLPKVQMAVSSPPVKNPEDAMKYELDRLPAPSIEPIDSAAYFSLLGESFAKLSTKTKKLESKAVIQGAENILLDSLLCALGPLLLLTRQIPELHDALDHKKLAETLSNIAHIMPGL